MVSQKRRNKFVLSDDTLFDSLVLFLSFVVLAIVAYPLLYVVSASFSDPMMVTTGQLTLLPRDFTLQAYETILGYTPIWIGYRNSIFYTSVGTLINLFVTLPCAYALSRKDLLGRKSITLVFAFTMFFSGGIIPLYLVVRGLGLLNTVWALMLPVAASMWNILIARTYYQASIPDSLRDSAQMDGCSNTRLFMEIIMPLSKPIIAVMTIFYAVNHWNRFFHALLFITSDNLQPLQIFLRNVLVVEELDMIGADTEMIAEILERRQLRETMKYGIIVVASVPVLVLYPFLQKYFVTGVMIGSIKG